MSNEEGLTLIENHGLPFVKSANRLLFKKSRGVFITITVDRVHFQPCITVKEIKDGDELYKNARQYYDWSIRGVGLTNIINEANHVASDGKTPFRQRALEATLQTIAKDLEKKGIVTSDQCGDFKKDMRKFTGIFFKYEASRLETTWVEEGDGKNIKILETNFAFDDAAFKSCGRHEEIHASEEMQNLKSEELEAKKNGIIYVKSGISISSGHHWLIR